MSLTRVTIPLSKNLVNEDIEGINTLKHDLTAMGIIVTLSNPLAEGELVFEYDRDAYKRGAGRKRKQAPPDGKLGAMNKVELDDWIARTDAGTIAKELGVSRSTAYRRKAEARQRMEYAMVRVDERE